MNRTESIHRAKTEEFDICIIGGGITGAGLLTTAMQRGWKTILIEKNDLASGTSSRSSKVIHGGVRYLRFFRLGLVYEALHERGQLLKLFPHLVKPIPFILPSYHSNADLLSKKITLSIYDRLAGKSVISSHTRLNAKEVVEKMPGFKSNQLKGGILYWEACTNDARLTIDVISDSALNGATVFNYMEAKLFEFNNDTVNSLTCFDKISNEKINIQAKVYINATGVWTDHVLQRLCGKPSAIMKPSKGIHVVVPSEKLPDKYACIFPSDNNDKRYLYSLPWENNLTVLGTTDTEYKGNADKVEVTKNEIQYVLDAFNASFPNAPISFKDIISVFAGLRPLVVNNFERDSYSRSREYRIWWSKSNFVNIAGGKFTSFLSMGKKCLDLVARKFRHFQMNSYPGSENHPGKWKSNYGPFEKFIGNILLENPEYNKRVSDKWEYTKAEIIFFTRYQFAQQVEDILTRRTTVTYAMKDFDNEFVEKVASIMSKELGKERSWVEDQKSRYYEHWSEYHPEFLINYKNNLALKS